MRKEKEVICFVGEGHDPSVLQKLHPPFQPEHV